MARGKHMMHMLVIIMVMLRVKLTANERACNGMHEPVCIQISEALLPAGPRRLCRSVHGYGRG